MSSRPRGPPPALEALPSLAALNLNSVAVDAPTAQEKANERAQRRARAGDDARGQLVNTRRGMDSLPPGDEPGEPQPEMTDEELDRMLDSADQLLRRGADRMAQAREEPDDPATAQDELEALVVRHMAQWLFDRYPWLKDTGVYARAPGVDWEYDLEERWYRHELEVGYDVRTASASGVASAAGVDAAVEKGRAEYLAGLWIRLFAPAVDGAPTERWKAPAETAGEKRASEALETAFVKALCAKMRFYGPWGTPPDLRVALDKLFPGGDAELDAFLRLDRERRAAHDAAVAAGNDLGMWVPEEDEEWSDWQPRSPEHQEAGGQVLQKRSRIKARQYWGVERDEAPQLPADAFEAAKEFWGAYLKAEAADVRDPVRVATFVKLMEREVGRAWWRFVQRCEPLLRRMIRDIRKNIVQRWNETRKQLYEGVCAELSTSLNSLLTALQEGDSEWPNASDFWRGNAFRPGSGEDAAAAAWASAKAPYEAVNDSNGWNAFQAGYYSELSPWDTVRFGDQFNAKLLLPDVGLFVEPTPNAPGGPGGQDEEQRTFERFFVWQAALKGQLDALDALLEKKKPALGEVEQKFYALLRQRKQVELEFRQSRPWLTYDGEWLVPLPSSATESAIESRMNTSFALLIARRAMWKRVRSEPEDADKTASGAFWHCYHLLNGLNDQINRDGANQLAKDLNNTTDYRQQGFNDVGPPVLLSNGTTAPLQSKSERYKSQVPTSQRVSVFTIFSKLQKDGWDISKSALERIASNTGDAAIVPLQNFIDEHPGAALGWRWMEYLDYNQFALDLRRVYFNCMLVISSDRDLWKYCLAKFSTGLAAHGTIVDRELAIIEFEHFERARARANPNASPNMQPSAILLYKQRDGSLNPRLPMLKHGFYIRQLVADLARNPFSVAISGKCLRSVPAPTNDGCSDGAGWADSYEHMYANMTLEVLLRLVFDRVRYDGEHGLALFEYDLKRLFDVADEWYSDKPRWAPEKVQRIFGHADEAPFYGSMNHLKMRHFASVCKRFYLGESKNGVDNVGWGTPPSLSPPQETTSPRRASTKKAQAAEKAAAEAAAAAAAMDANVVLARLGAVKKLRVPALGHNGYSEELKYRVGEIDRVLAPLDADQRAEVLARMHKELACQNARAGAPPPPANELPPEQLTFELVDTVLNGVLTARVEREVGELRSRGASDDELAQHRSRAPAVGPWCKDWGEVRKAAEGGGSSYYDIEALDEENWRDAQDVIAAIDKVDTGGLGGWGDQPHLSTLNWVEAAAAPAAKGGGS